jgi:predicted secreted protein
MASEAFSGHGTKLKRVVGVSSDSSSAQYSLIGELIDITGPNMTKETIDVTNKDSVNRFREFLSGLRDGGEITVTCNFVKDAFLHVKQSYMMDILETWIIVLPDTDNTEISFSGTVTSLGMSNPLTDKVSADFTIKISGEITITGDSSGI